MKLQCRELELELGRRTYIMGILNLTPDSFSDGGKYNQIEAALQHAKEMIEEGADILDIGGESTRPGHIQISEEEEIERVLPVIRSLRKQFPHVLLSIDTYKWKVAEAALKAGVHILNDIWGLQYDKGEMAALAKKYEVPVIVMHNQNTEEYQEDRVQTLRKFFEKSFEIAERVGLSKEKLLLDPGLGFGKGFLGDVELLGRLSELRDMGPILLGTSKKRFIGTLLQGLPPEERVEGTAATTVIGIQQGVDIVRVHNVKENKRVAMVADAIYRKGYLSDTVTYK
ncbi:dihydropteroate synthase [Fusobacterium necrophorum subsp. funduliforme ATCC 51357]|uniref:Dihydropteroate synthase n=1 Tax=Fusobacterium necrophorum subsp. funduliforme TaxID=143387 RepID=A0A162J0M0_9FUSO|nr:dihydropteroate synthase [Fusobacterium necrophorum]AYV93358.1 dihydropteroate synthase [Fusobacterium necrophorum subsp. funduliforme]EIJ72516.1 dihydropteroate synthase [Fusobacterium necrophorum subsp. funduliforme ATCC 51357]KAB0552087.1 dihydropteroate synthase [Fusobacterium necrophorum subsp. funduliforme]KYL04819.1 dihydropteroate synthase [Fusobacterium necrophorum subsp. funduliforme]KYM45574.1 dihydropteroate synthase [Fusobacterium necrophorum subsp. funduliforme]